MNTFSIFASTMGALLVAAPLSAATTFELGGSSDDAVAKSFTQDGMTLIAAGFTYGGPPSGFPNGVDGLTDAPLHQSTAGIGVCPAGETGVLCDQVDSDAPGDSEGVLFFLADQSDFAITSIVFSIIDSNDTLQLVGQTATEQVLLGYTGFIAGGLVGATTTSLGGDTYRVDLATGGFQAFLFGQQRQGGDGFRINSITIASAVPEPATWLTMVAGFALLGSATRKRGRVARAA